jgi:tRNA(adenine34) deaminase
LREACCREKNYRLPGATLYVTIEPCAMCAGAIVHARIARVVYGALEPKAGAVTSTQRFFDAPQLNHKVTFEGGCLAEECGAAISAFFQSRREQQKKLKHRLRGDPGDASVEGE